MIVCCAMVGTALRCARRPYITRPTISSPTHNNEAKDQPGKGGNDREANIDECPSLLVTLPEQYRIKRESRKGRVATEHAGGEEQPQSLGRVRLEREVAGEQSHDQGAADVLKQSVKRERGTKPTGKRDVDAMAGHSA